VIVILGGSITIAKRIGRREAEQSPMASYTGFEPERIRHLEMIQAVVARLAGYQFLVRGWALTVAGAFLGFAVNNHEWRLAVASLAPTVTFWFLDLYFLHSERLFRSLFNQVRKADSNVEPFFMAATSDEFENNLPQDERSWPKTFRRPAVFFFYLGILVFTSLVLWFTTVNGPPARGGNAGGERRYSCSHASRTRSATPAINSGSAFSCGGQIGSILSPG
jgi:hypothetical protein